MNTVNVLLMRPALSACILSLIPHPSSLILRICRDR